MAEPKKNSLPVQYSVDLKIHKNPVRQVLRPSRIAGGPSEEIQIGKRHGDRLVGPDGRRTVLTPGPLPQPGDFDDALLVKDSIEMSDLSGCRWLVPKGKTDVASALAARDAARESWKGQLHFKEEAYVSENEVVPGLRSPQIGAIFAALGHWKSSEASATIVMPTGTGKTETMLALLVRERPERLLVVVPNTALRGQIAAKFQDLGVLKEFGIVGEAAERPVVGTLLHRPKTPEEVEEVFGPCNVIVTNMQIVGGCGAQVQRKMADLCSHLFIDEAHHIAAPTWHIFRRFFGERRILQFTATPFRNDGKHLDGKVIFDYPLRKAQEEKYFKPINFKPVAEFNPEASDGAIAAAAVNQLASDLKAGHDHLVMARASSIERAGRIQKIYAKLAPARNPLLVHSEMPDAEKRAALAALGDRSCRIIVCVDMLGEGFDLPELKIAALHDMHKSLAVTLQFTGRFTRVKDKIGDATVIANLADAAVQGALRDLYAEDADWNAVLRDLSAGATGKHRQRTGFIEGFEDVPPEIPLQNLMPKMSAVVYRCKRPKWNPDGVHAAVKQDRLYVGPTVNHVEKTLIFVTRDRMPVQWGDVRTITDTVWNLFLVHWDEERKLLFINSSDNSGQYEELARAIAGDDAELIRGEDVFRSMAGINHLTLSNLGLSHSLSRAVRFTMYVGPDIKEGVAEAHTQNKIKTNLFGRGFEGGQKASVGCSRKGRVWAHRIAYDMSEWVEWCHQVGGKLTDSNVSIEQIFGNLVVPKQVDKRPDLVPLAIEWSEEFLKLSEEAIHVEVDGDSVPFYEAGLELTTHEPDGPLTFRVFTAAKSAEYEVRFRGGTVEYVPTGTAEVEVVVGRRRKALSEWFQLEAPVVRFEDNSYLIYNELCVIPGDKAAYGRDNIVAWDWSGVDLRRESQTTEKFEDSIQRKVILHLLEDGHEPEYDIVFDDDDTNEAADIVAIKVAGERLIVHLFHCKYAQKGKAGARVKDLYEVCGQAQKCVHWKGKVEGLMDHMRKREGQRIVRTGVSRFERGTLAKLVEIRREAPFLIPEFKAFIVQPALSRRDATEPQLDLLGATELYLKETYGLDMSVIGSD